MTEKDAIENEIVDYLGAHYGVDREEIRAATTLDEIGLDSLGVLAIADLAGGRRSTAFARRRTHRKRAHLRRPVGPDRTQARGSGMTAYITASGRYLLGEPGTERRDRGLYRQGRARHCCRKPDHLGVLCRAIGSDVDITVHGIRTWAMESTHAQMWSNGRVFVAGDAAHTFPPTGGFGMNTGVQDAHALAWRLAGVLAGWGRTAPLGAYGAERGPVAAFNAAQSEANARAMWALLATGDPDATEIERQRPHFDFTGQALGFRYGADPAVADVVDYTPVVAPGARAPHFYSSRRRRASGVETLDLGVHDVRPPHRDRRRRGVGGGRPLCGRRRRGAGGAPPDRGTARVGCGSAGPYRPDAAGLRDHRGGCRAGPSRRPHVRDAARRRPLRGLITAVQMSPGFAMQEVPQ